MSFSCSLSCASRLATQMSVPVSMRALPRVAFSSSLTLLSACDWCDDNRRGCLIPDVILNCKHRSDTALLAPYNRIRIRIINFILMNPHMFDTSWSVCKRLTGGLIGQAEQCSVLGIKILPYCGCRRTRRLVRRQCDCYERGFFCSSPIWKKSGV